MREIKFRGLWDDGTGILQWVYGFYHKDHDTDIHLIQDLSFMSSSAIIRNPETVGQYTGLKDKNGKEIYEGDVITNGRDDAVVVFDEGTFLAKIGKYCATESVYNFDYCTVFEVVGNIRENPELLEVSHETL